MRDPNSHRITETLIFDTTCFYWRETIWMPLYKNFESIDTEEGLTQFVGIDPLLKISWNRACVIDFGMLPQLRQITITWIL